MKARGMDAQTIAKLTDCTPRPLRVLFDGKPEAEKVQSVQTGMGSG